MHGISENLEVRLVENAITAGASISENSDRIDMSDYDSVVFVATINSSTATGVATFKIRSNDADQDSGMADVTGASVSLTCAVNGDLNGKVLMVELRNPMKRYVQARLTSATAAIGFGETFALLKPKRRPVSQHASIGARAYVSN